MKVQPIAQDDKASFWLPLSWKVTLLGDPSFGAGTTDIVARVGPAGLTVEHPGGTMTAPLVYVGAASPAVLQHIDVKGKIAVQLIVPQGHMMFERRAVDSRAEDLVKRGAVGRAQPRSPAGQRGVARLQQLRQPVLQHRRPRRLFLEQVLERAARGGVGDSRPHRYCRPQTCRGLKAEQRRRRDSRAGTG